MLRTALTLAAATALATTAAAPAAAAPASDRGDQGRAAQVLRVDLDALNDSGVDGRAVLILRGDQLRVNIRAKGLTPGKVHFQHIHGLADDENATCPPPEAADAIDGEPEEASEPDELISVGEGARSYGPVLLPLTPYPTANRAGVVTYSETFPVDGDLTDLSDEVIVLHGAVVDGQYTELLPVACGQID